MYRAVSKCVDKEMTENKTTEPQKLALTDSKLLRYQPCTNKSTKSPLQQFVALEVIIRFRFNVCSCK